MPNETTDRCATHGHRYDGRGICCWCDAEIGRSKDQPARDQSTVTPTDMLLTINAIHLHAVAARLGGDDGSIMLAIEQLAEDILERACNEGANDTEFTIEAEYHG